MKSKNYTEHIEYLLESTKLMLFFLWRWLKAHPDESFQQAIRNRIDIFRKTDINSGNLCPDNPEFDNPVWLKMEHQANEIYYNSRNAAQFEQYAFTVFKGNILARSERDYKYSCQKPEGYKCGSLTYHQPNKDDPHVIAVHIANAVAPKSIFDDPDYLPHCLYKFMNMAEKEFGCSRLHCGSWLNSHPRWLELFPQEWQDNLSEPDENIQWHYGFWGQFITARGTFHWKNAERLRRTGKMPFPFRTSNCSFKNLKIHLSK